MVGLRLFLLSGLCLVSGCSGGPAFVGRPDLRYVGGGELPAPTRSDMVVAARPYAIGPADQLSVEVYGIPELSRSVTVDLGGQISLPLAGTIAASGLTAPELAVEVARRLRSNVRDPQVTVNVTSAANQTVTVDGAVSAPGIYPIPGEMSLMRVIARASGLTEFARSNYVVVFRQVGGAEYAALYDLRAIRQGLYPDPQIYSNDVVVVDESRARRIFKDVLAASGLITAPVVALVR